MKDKLIEAKALLKELRDIQDRLDEFRDIRNLFVIANDLKCVFQDKKYQTKLSKTYTALNDTANALCDVVSFETNGYTLAKFKTK
ncbi:hypothetical protein RLOatenuis_3160 [Rickettsiales bacterium]|nr:hypothetical protein RLOatenuis_3160 [Rickettsiales bacterium]